MVFCTSICANYIPKARVLARSIKKFNPNAIVVVCLVEPEIPDFARNVEYFDEIILAKDMGIKDFDSFIFKHSIVEASTSVKGYLFQYLFKKYSQYQKFVYLDPDVEVFSELTELESILDTKSIVLAPHMLEPENTLDAVLDNEINSMQYGAFNLGFLAVRSDFEGKRFINWWSARLSVLCFDYFPSGVFTDQRWIDLAPGFFDVFVLRHVGYDVAPWNLSKRNLTEKNHNYFVNGDELRFFHFSSIDSKAHLDMVNKYVPDKKNVVYNIWSEYVQQLQEMGQNQYGVFPWGYSCFSNGKKISNKSRLRYAIDPFLEKSIDSPFLSSNSTILFKFNRMNADRLGLLLLGKLGFTFFEKWIIKLQNNKRHRFIILWYWKIKFVIFSPKKFLRKYFRNMYH